MNPKEVTKGQTIDYKGYHCTVIEKKLNKITIEHNGKKITTTYDQIKSL